MSIEITITECFVSSAVKASIAYRVKKDAQEVCENVKEIDFRIFKKNFAKKKRKNGKETKITSISFDSEATEEHFGNGTRAGSHGFRSIRRRIRSAERMGPRRSMYPFFYYYFSICISCASAVDHLSLTLTARHLRCSLRPTKPSPTYRVNCAPASTPSAATSKIRSFVTTSPIAK